MMYDVQMEAELSGLACAQRDQLLEVSGLHVLCATLGHLEALATAEGADMQAAAAVRLTECPHCDQHSIALAMVPVLLILL